ncbi:MAG: family 43 glycosylhydrolase [Verrucomicrobiae bacterium]|nr:family 43 glycosylhydrolase [Verrucomicrobiae bacterium]
MALIVLLAHGLAASAQPAQPEARPGKLAPKPLYRDPIHDGAADPVVVWNRLERKWFMFYTNRRANATNDPGVAWVHGTHIGIAESSDDGATWRYRGTARIGYGQTNYTYWAPEVIEHEGTYHMFLTVVPGIFTNWNAPRDIVHLTSTNLLDWKFESVLKLASDRVIDACVLRLPDGTWRMWYNNERDRKSIYYADSHDLFTWTDRGKAIGDQRCEGPKVFHWKGRYWMIVDNWRGLGVYRSDDLLTWTRQPEPLLQQPGNGPDDGVIGQHPDVVVSDERAFLFYFTHPGRRGEDARKDGYEQRRSSIQVVELEFKDGWLTCDRDKPTYIELKPPMHVHRAVFTPAQREVKWTLAELDPALPTDWSGYSFLALEFRASSPAATEVRVFTTDGIRKVRLHPLAGAWTRAALPLRFFAQRDRQGHDLAALGNKPHGAYWLNLTGAVGPLTNVQAIGFAMDAPIGTQTFELRVASLHKESPGDAVLGPKPLVDEFGQWIHDDWPGKARSLEDLKSAWATDRKRLGTGEEFGYCKFGGYAAPKARATGFFRVEQIDGRWWFVDPDGHLFFSVGVNVITPWVGTPVAGREDLFAALPPPELRKALGQQPRPGRAPDASFYTWNLSRRFGDAWLAQWIELTLDRLDAWGFNTIGNWSDRRLWDAKRKPYVVMLRGWGIETGYLGLPDVFAPEFTNRVEEAAREQCAPRKDDPWLLGYFVANEPPWPGRELDIVEAILAGPDAPIQRALKQFLADGDSPERRREFVYAAVEQFLEVVNGAIRRHDPNHLNLGLRFGSHVPDRMLRAARTFDVFSLNCYDYKPDPAMLDRVYRVTGRPILIGEFHFGVPGRGLAPGLRQTANQSERGAAYQYYVENAAAHPAVIGAHWFQWADQPATGRFDGENYNIGFVDVTDLPYAELVEAAKVTHNRLFDVHAGSKPPTTRRPIVN